MNPQLAAIAAGQHGVFSRAQARATGYRDDEISRLLRREWARMRHGVYVERAVRAEYDDSGRRHLLQLAAFLLRRPGRDLVASHDSAAAIHGIATLDRVGDAVRLTDPIGHAGERVYDGSLIRPADVPASDRTIVDDLPVTSVARTVVDRAREVAFLDALISLDHALYTGKATQGQIEDVVRRCTGWPGMLAAARVLRCADGRSESPAETMARARLIEAGLPTPELQEWLLVAGRNVRVDFLWPSYATVGEVDGKIKYESDDGSRQTLYDEKRREDQLREAGFEVVRFTAAEARYQPEVFGPRMRRAFARAVARHGGQAAAAAFVERLRGDAGRKIA
jgi:very-short-patch-repair endonuclease